MTKTPAAKDPARQGPHIEIKIGVGKASKVGEVTIKDARRTRRTPP